MPKGIPRIGRNKGWFVKGVKFSPEFREKMSNAHKNKPSPMLGKKHSLESKLKASLALKGRKKKPFSEIHKLRIREHLRNLHHSSNPTSIELKLYRELKNRGFLFEMQKLVNGRFIVDAYIPKLNLIIEADGNYWHSLDRVKKKDKAENAYLKTCGFNLLRLSETEINNGKFRKSLSI